MIIYLCLLFLIFNTLSVFSQSTNDKITQGQVIRDGQTIISESQNYTLGFFSPGNSSSRYVGVWYSRVPAKTVIWVANRENPISHNSGILSFGNDGNLILSDGNSSIYWSTNTSSISTNSTAVLMDSGNLAICRSEDIDDTRKALWQSFALPTDNFLPDMRVYTVSRTRTVERAVLTSWKSPNDPSPGNYSVGFDPRGSPQIVVWRGLNRLWRSGHWNGLIFIGVPTARARYLYGFKLNTEKNGDMYFIYTTVDRSEAVRFSIGWNGAAEQLIWNEGRQDWDVEQSQPSTECEEYNKCGNFGVCSMEDSRRICSCIEGFVPRFADQWDRGNWSGGCIRRNSLKCDSNGTNDGFLEVEGVKLPDFADTLAAAGNLWLCENQCKNNCSCNAYAYVSGIGCMAWSDDLVDIEHLAGGNTLYLRVANSELGGKKKLSNIAIIIIAVLGTIILGVIFWASWRFREKLKIRNPWEKQNNSVLTSVNRSQEISTALSGADELDIEGKQGNGPQLPLFSFHYVELATNNFADENKLGQGGFGPVYKGTLPGGQEVAFKRLSKRSGQGLEEFKTEMILIAKLQHRNLVRLLGCCIEGEEKLLIYEYMPNKSLDSFLFDPTQKVQLDWNKRFTIIEGVARGLLYLHRDSRLRIIHRDLKASNILLDEEMNPKISDFGMARIFGGNQNEGNTVRVVGTYGYMSPEYAMEGLFSVKSDVYSFGVLLLEIVSGQRNTTFRSPECTNLIGYAWNLWKDGNAVDLIDPIIMDSCPRDVVLQCIHVGMLCVQISAASRPTMSSVLRMLESESVSLPLPRLPDINSSGDMDLIVQDPQIISSTEVTITKLIGR